MSRANYWNRLLAFFCSQWLALMCVSVAHAGAESRTLLWGDTHVHTEYSSDAYLNNNISSDPNTALRYARGLPVIHPYHQARVQIQTPLDFLVVSDHAVLLGVIRHMHREGLDMGELGFIDSLKARFFQWRLREAINKREGRDFFFKLMGKPTEPREAARNASESGGGLPLPGTDVIQANTWKTITDMVESHNRPGEFSALIGWEWTPTPGGANLHRVVLSDGNSDSAQSYQPFSSVDSPYPEDLWNWLADTSKATGDNFISIPHNSNISKGLMFEDKTLKGDTFTHEYATKRARWERLAEITQFKGDSETHPALSPNDDFANFEHYPFYIQGGYTEFIASPGAFVRAALKRGLSLEQSLKVNPFKFGVIGSTDSHTGLASAEENNFWGKMATDSIPANKNPKSDVEYPRSSGWAMSASGLAAVWAEENTREAIVAAMRRREVYATTGPRIKVQFFAAEVFGDLTPDADNLYQQATSLGVAMGGELRALSNSPEFIVSAVSDPNGAYLDRIQIIKTWIDHDGNEHERVHDVAWGKDRALLDSGKLASVGNTVNVKTGNYENSVGNAQLSAKWQDPEFDAALPSLYYARVLQIPTPRHSLLDAIALGQEHAASQPDTLQERAYTSAIWYSPNH
ncbi:MAG: DUF3604 domain-containing protein [Pseudomonadota bacterium]